MVIVGGIDMMSQSLALAKKPHIIVGRLQILKLSCSNFVIQLYRLSSHLTPKKVLTNNDKHT